MTNQALNYDIHKQDINLDPKTKRTIIVQGRKYTEQDNGWLKRS